MGGCYCFVQKFLFRPLGDGLQRARSSSRGRVSGGGQRINTESLDARGRRPGRPDVYENLPLDAPGGGFGTAGFPDPSASPGGFRGFLLPDVPPLEEPVFEPVLPDDAAEFPLLTVC
mmetsp:Transcript_19365/g.48458  ORF Transcript_19365/g.48458 Transcript_19365/m.48458 type:complete len:117 (+) Transcript_19365:484-834(+)